MIELKANTPKELVMQGRHNEPVYLKSEADKELRRQKYKRCLANAEAAMHKRWRNDEGFDYARSTRHMNKWLELSEKFKPNN